MRTAIEIIGIGCSAVLLKLDDFRREMKTSQEHVPSPPNVGSTFITEFPIWE